MRKIFFVLFFFCLFSASLRSNNHGFAAGTQVNTDFDEYELIENIKPGSSVLAFDFTTETVTYAKVKAVNKQTEKKLIKLTVDKKPIFMGINQTLYLPFWWYFIASPFLQRGDQLFKVSLGDFEIVEGVEIIEQETDLYALEIELLNNYFVEDVLTHNHDCFAKE